MKTLLILLIFTISIGGLLAQNNEATLDSMSVEVGMTNDTLPGSQMSQTSVTGERDVYFLHGLGGDAKSWNLTSEFLEYHYKLTRTVPVYDDYTNGNLESAAKRVHEVINNENATPIDPNTAIMIGHSQGGMVAKSLDRLGRVTSIPKYQQQHYGGIVTFGSPHLGSELVEKTLLTGGTGEFEAFLSDGCNKLGRAEIDNLISQHWQVDLAFDFTGFTPYLLANLPSSLCGAFSSTIMKVLAAQFVSPISQEYKPNGYILDTLNTYNTNVPIVNFYGEELEPALFRLMSSLDVDVNVITSANPFNANNDNKYVNATNAMINHYNAKGILEAQKSQIYLNQAYILLSTPFNIQKAKIKKALSKSALENSGYNFDAANWLMGANDRWLELIGAQKTLVDTSEYCACDYIKIGRPEIGSMVLFKTLDTASVNCDVTNGNMTVYRFTTPVPGLPNECDCEYYDSPSKTNRLFTQIEYLSNCPNNGSYTALQMNKLCNKVIYYNARQHIYPNDGLVLSSSAAGYPAAVAYRKMKETNHFQMRNCSETEKSFMDLFHGNIPSTQFFHISKR